MHLFSVALFTAFALNLFSAEGKTELLGGDSPISMREQTAAATPKGPAARVPAANRTAQTPTTPPSQAMDAECNSYLQFGGNYTWTRIKPEGLEATSGNTGGLQGSYEYKPQNCIYGGLTFAWRQGDTDNAAMGRSICYIDAQERIGYTYSRCQNWMGTGFIGLGYRHYGEDVTVPSDEVDFEYNEIYVPIGLLIDGKLNSCCCLGLNMIWMPQAYSTVKIDPLEGARWILSTECANFRVEVPFTWHFSREYHGFISLVPLFEYWKDGETDATTELGTTLVVPRNTYYFAGVNLNLGYSF